MRIGKAVQGIGLVALLLAMACAPRASAPPPTPPIGVPVQPGATEAALEAAKARLITNPKFADSVLPGPEQMIGACTREMQGICTNNARFHRQLARLGKTALNSTERSLLHLDLNDIKGLGTRRVTNPMFVYEISQ